MNGLVRTDRLDPAQIALATGGVWLVEPTQPILGAAIDSREVRSGNLFFALPGEHTDGHAFVAAAEDTGAAAVVVSCALDELPEGFRRAVGVLRADDPAGALASLAAAYRRALPGVRTVGVTGSNGKTTTVRLIHAALRASGLRGTHALKSHNNDLGVPLTILNAGPRDDYLICEIGTNAPGEIRPLAALVAPDVAVITSVGRSHLEALGSVAGVAQEKGELVRALGESGVAVVTGDCAELDAELDASRGGPVCTTIRVGLSENCDVVVSSIISQGGETRFIAGGRPLRVPLPGAHNACNGAIAMAVAGVLGADPDLAADGLASAEGPAMRLERSDVPIAGGVIRLINDAYNANPESVLAAIAMLNGGVLDPSGSGQPTRRVAVLGDMLELGASTGEAHREILGVLAGSDSVDLVVCVGYAYSNEKRDDPRFRYLLPEDGWPGRVASLLEPGDTVLLKGSRGIRLERLLGRLGNRQADGVG